MSDKQFEPCTLTEATHIEINGVVHEITERGGKVKRSIDFGWIDILVGENKWVEIPVEVFFALGIKCLRKVKPTPIEFEHIFTFEETSLGIIPDEAEGKKFKCVEILEEEK